MGTIGRDWQADDGRRFRAAASPLMDLSPRFWHPDAAQVVANDLAPGFPLINGAPGHATLMAEMTCPRDHQGGGLVARIVAHGPFVPLRQAAVPHAQATAARGGRFSVARAGAVVGLPLCRAIGSPAGRHFRQPPCGAGPCG